MSVSKALPDQSEALAVLERILQEGFATGNDAIVDEVCAPDVIEHQFGLAGSGAEAIAQIKRAIRDVHAMMPDVVYTIEDSVTHGDTVWARGRARGTATGPFFGPPSGAPIDIHLFEVARVVDGRIVEHWGCPDRFAVLAQTGALARLSN
ncbi:SnoaL-like polyketide cyclase [Kribbella voronezhensis]|uniref:SnoaL-like polyketide cyclase n=1 Tax=Kribbella voronezhensis TaxID=2512212 RepID=A0A4R7T5U9_9ACTN|nr:ester cyclase [Kribbella voronezhensis]TDU87222.1 SnoaL-like polyketide cyclase [Kribbella voronezhensis]